ncbi:MAG: hypothetical protein AAB368_14155 [bacterium]
MSLWDALMIALCFCAVSDLWACARRRIARWLGRRAGWRTGGEDD